MPRPSPLLLRAAPNVILVGEIRDAETAEIAIQSALTGHLVFSTLHTNDAASSITRLVDMGIDKFMVASSTILIAAQRLCRKLCDKCKAPVDTMPEKKYALGLGFKYYAIHFGRYHQTYGNVGGVAILLVLFYLDALVLLIGAEINSEIDFEVLRVKRGSRDFLTAEDAQPPRAATSVGAPAAEV